MAQTAASTRSGRSAAAKPAPSTDPFRQPDTEPAGPDRYARFQDPDKATPDPGSAVEGQMLYERLTQPKKPPALRLETPIITPETAQEMIDHTHRTDPTFNNRKIYPAQVVRWKGLMRTGRFVQWSEDGPILVTDDGIMLNGWHRLTAVIESGIACGFVVIHGARREHMLYFDQGKVRTLSDSMKIATGDVPKFQAASTARLGYRFEEFILGVRPPTGWRQWGSAKGDEHADVINYLAIRDGLTDTYAEAARIYQKTTILVPSLMVWRFYQLLAWEDGWEEQEAFWQGLLTGAELAKGHPALVLREYTKRQSYGSMPAKREGYLMLLNLCFRTAMDGDTMEKIELGYGLPMEGPYHPDGRQVAAANVGKAIDRLKRDYAKTKR